MADLVISRFTDTLDALLSQSDAGPIRHPIVDDFLESSWIRQHVRNVAERSVARIRGSTPDQASPEADNPAIMFRDGEEIIQNDSGQKRELFLRSGNAKSSYISIFDSPYLIVAIDNILVHELSVVGLASDDYYDPHKNVYLRLERRIEMQPGEVITRSNRALFFDVQPSDSAKYLVYVRDRKTGYRLVFDKSTMHLCATGGFDFPTAKSLLYLELLEEIGSDFIAEISLSYTDHPSPIVRWRALSALNKIGHANTKQILERFCSDEAAFVSKNARRILNEGANQW